MFVVLPVVLGVLLAGGSSSGTTRHNQPAAAGLRDRCGRLGILPLVQRCADGSHGGGGGGGGGTVVPLSSSTGWRITAQLSDSAARFAATELQHNLSVTHGVNISVVDSESLATPAARHRFIAVGVPRTDLALAAAARGAGLLLRGSNSSAASLAATAPEGYFLVSRPDCIFLLGSGPAGAFYAVQSFMQVVATCDASAVPSAITIQDWPDTPIRGAEIEFRAGGRGEEWWREVGRTMARMKLNLLGPDSLQVPFGFSSSSGQLLMPSAATVASIRSVQSYLADRYIDVALIVGAPKMDPRVLEGKWVRDEPFRLDPRNGEAVPLISSATGYPANGNFAHVSEDGTTPLGWTFDRGSDTKRRPPCTLDRHNSADSAGNSVVCNVQHYPMPCPYSPAECNASMPHGSSPELASVLSDSRRGRAEPMHYNVSGPLSSDVFPIRPGSMYLLSFAASWRGNWSGSFTASVSLFQYRSAEEATTGENPSDPLYPSTVNFIPCRGGDARACIVWHSSSGIPRLPAWGRYSTNFITMPSARFLRVRSFISGWGAGQWWIDDVKITRVDGELKNVVVTPDAAVNVTSSDCGGEACVRGRDFDFQAVPLDPTGNFSALQPLVIARLPRSRLRDGSLLNLSYNVLPGAANRMVGGRDVCCYSEPLYTSHMKRMIEFTVDTFGRIETSSDRKQMMFLDADGFDEQMGLGRDSRTLSSGLSNGAIIGNAMNSLQGMIAKSAAQAGLDHTPTLAVWADMVNRDHNGGQNYSYLSGAGRRQGYWPAIDMLDRRILLFSWTYDSTDYDRRIINDDPAYFQQRKQGWVGCSWTSLLNVKLWKAAVQAAKKMYGNRSVARGLMCTNWGGGRFEAGLLPTARAAWNLDDPLDDVHDSMLDVRIKSEDEESATVGRGKSELVLPLPMLGWSTWESFGCFINHTLLEQSIHAMAASPLKKSGYNWILIDDCWTTCKGTVAANGLCSEPGDRDAAGHPVPDPEKFPSGFTPLTALAHSLGLLIGIYTSVSAATCAGYTGSFQHEATDAAAFVSWGFDSVKHDSCGRDYSVHDGSYQAAVSRMRDGIWAAGQAAGRKIVYYLDSGNPTSPQRVFNPYAHGIPDYRDAMEIQQESYLKLAVKSEELVWVWATKWGRDSVVADPHDVRGRLVDDKGPHMFKSWFDRQDSWDSVLTNTQNQIRLAEYQRPSQLHMPDYLTVGKGAKCVGNNCAHGAGSQTPSENRAQFYLWVILAAPLIHGCDIRSLDNFTTKMVTSKEVLAVNQDPQCIQGSMVRAEGSSETWIKPLSDGTFAVLLLNKGTVSSNATVYFDNGGELWGSGVDFFPAIFQEMFVRDLTTGTDLGVHSSTFHAVVPAHDALLLKMAPPSSIKSNCTNFTRFLQGNQCDDKSIIGVGSMRGTTEACFAWCQESGLCKFFSFSGNDTAADAERAHAHFAGGNTGRGTPWCVRYTVCVPRKVHATNYDSFKMICTLGSTSNSTTTTEVVPPLKTDDAVKAGIQRQERLTIIYR
jgi:alpha-galactosidase